MCASSTKLCGPDYLIEYRPALDQATLSRAGATLLSARCYKLIRFLPGEWIL